MADKPKKKPQRLADLPPLDPTAPMKGPSRIKDATGKTPGTAVQIIGAAKPAAPTGNALYYGDNLDVMRRYIKDESVDLIYLDPPFNSNADYNMLFGQRGEPVAAAQIKAFGDTWRWDTVAAATWQEVVESGGPVSQAMQAFRQFLGTNDMLAYLSMMAPRLLELKRVLKSTGSIYLHCDPTASHYLKMLMDAVFGPNNFRNEIIWKRTGSHGGAKRWGPIHDTLLFYSKTDDYLWKRVFQDYDEEYVDDFYRFEDKKGRYRLVSLTGAGTRTGDSGAPWKEVDPTKVGRHWALPGYALKELATEEQLAQMTTQSKLDLLDSAGLIYWPPKGKVPQQKRYLEDGDGVSIQDVVTDIQPISSQAQERMHYPTQKPIALLRRIISASCPQGGLVFDPFCGCGTTVDAAQEMGFPWVGIDITHLAINAIKGRLRDRYLGKAEYKVIGEPVSLPDAAQLAKDDPYQFQFWSLGLVGARPDIEKKGADQGVDGRLFFHDESESGKTKQIIFSVKAGNIKPAYVSELRGVIDREKADIGVLITMEEPTKAMKSEAASADFYVSPFGKYPRLQILTIADLLSGKGIDYPSAAQRIDKTFKKAPRAEGANRETGALPL